MGEWTNNSVYTYHDRMPHSIKSAWTQWIGPKLDNKEAYKRISFVHSMHFKNT
jgi:hypothetical protein